MQGVFAFFPQLYVFFLRVHDKRKNANYMLVLASTTFKSMGAESHNISILAGVSLKNCGQKYVNKLFQKPL